jgi:hypothetical protein
VADVYGSTEEIKARGQTIVGLLHQEAGHLGIFVSGKVAKKEHAQIGSALKSIEALPPGLYGMRINETRDADGKMGYEVELIEHRLEEVAARLNRFERRDEKPFQAAKAVSDLNRQAYELFVRPLVQAFASEEAAQLGRELHPLRWQRWALSDENPWLWWLAPAAEAVKAQRQPAGSGQPFRRLEGMLSELVSGSLDRFRDVRDALSEALFFQLYGNLFLTHMGAGEKAGEEGRPETPDPRTLPFVREALASVAEGGFPEALARVGALLAQRGRPIPLARLELKEQLIGDYKDLLPDLPRDAMRRIRGEQEIIVQYEPERALETLPQLLREPGDRERLRALLERLLADPRLPRGDVTPAQEELIGRIRGLLGGHTATKTKLRNGLRL